MRIGSNKVVLSGTAFALTAAPFAASSLHVGHGHSKGHTRRQHVTRPESNEHVGSGGERDHSPTTTAPAPTTGPTTSTTMTSTTTSTSTPSTTSTTAPPGPTVRVGAAFGATAIGSPLVFNASFANDAPSPQSITLTITLAAPGGALPGYSYPKTAPAYLACAPSEIQRPGANAVFTCSGSVPAASSGVVVISSGSNIVGTAGQPLDATVTAQPAGVTANASATYA